MASSLKEGVLSSKLLTVANEKNHLGPDLSNGFTHSVSMEKCVRTYGPYSLKRSVMNEAKYISFT